MRVVGTILVALVLLVAGSVLQDWLPGEHDDPVSTPHLRTADVGETVDLRTADLTVDEVTGTSTLLEFGNEQVSPGVWVVATYTLVAKQENTTIGFVEGTDAEGRVWGMDGRNTNICTDSPPGVEVHCVVSLEVPVDAVPTLHLRMARESRDTRYDVIAEIDLGLTADDARAFAGAEPLELPAATVGGDLS